MNTSGKTISNVFQRKIEDLDKGQESLVSSGIEEATKSVGSNKVICPNFRDCQCLSWTYAYLSCSVVLFLNR